MRKVPYSSGEEKARPASFGSRVKLKKLDRGLNSVLQNRLIRENSTEYRKKVKQIESWGCAGRVTGGSACKSSIFCSQPRSYAVPENIKIII